MSCNYIDLLTKVALLTLMTLALALTIKALNMGDVETFLANALEAPPKASVAKAVTVLHEMGALTARGKK